MEDHVGAKEPKVAWLPLLLGGGPGRMRQPGHKEGVERSDRDGGVGWWGRTCGRILLSP